MKKYTVISITQLTANTFRLVTERPDVNIVAGQCFNLGVPGNSINREYSMYSNSSASYLEFLIRAIDNGLVSSQLQQLKPGDFIEIDGPYGEFCIPTNKLELKFVFIATGTGIAPFHSFIKTYPNIDFKLIHGVRYANETYDSKDYPYDKYIPCISKNDNGQSMRVCDFLRDNPVPKDSIIYLCGNRNMIVDAVQILLDQGINGDQIISEVFF
jgi:ferredoxin-NADP reductase